MRRPIVFKEQNNLPITGIKKDILEGDTFISEAKNCLET